MRFRDFPPTLTHRPHARHLDEQAALVCRSHGSEPQASGRATSPLSYRWIAKKRGRPRLLEIPCPGLKRIQRQILETILNRIPAHPSAHGFRAGCSITSNALPHCGKDIVLRFDLADFFPSIPIGRVTRLFRTIGYPVMVARLLTGLCTTLLPHDAWDARPNAPLDGSDHAIWQRYAARHLPQGAPTSPALANLAAYRLDKRLSSLAQRLKADYTRYADDLAFSGSQEFAQHHRRFSELVARIVTEEEFALQFRKTRIMRQSGQQSVAGVVVNLRPNVRRKVFDQLKAILTNCLRHGPTNQNRHQHPDFHAHLAGRVAQIAALNPSRGQKLWAMFDRVDWAGLHQG